MIHMKSKPASKKKTKIKKPKVSFVILTHNSMRTLPHCIWSIKRQKVSREIIIIDGNSNDGTWEYAKRNADTRIHGITNLAHARELGASLAKGKYTAFIDSDVVIPYDWAESLISMIELFKVNSASSDFVSYPTNKVTKAIDKARSLNKPTTQITDNGYMQSSMWETKSLKDIHPDNFWSNGGEDLDIFNKASELGYTHMLTMNKLMNVRHYGVSTISDVIDKAFKYGKVHQQVIRKIPNNDSAWNMTKLLYYPLLIAFALISTIFITPFPIIACWLFPFITYAILLFFDRGQFDLTFTIVNGLKYHAHSLGMFVGIYNLKKDEKK